VLRRYERVCFDKELLRLAGKPPAELVAPGHPLLDAAVDLLLERYGTLLRQGAVLVDDTDPGETPRVLVYLEHAVSDARTDSHGNQRVVSRRFEFVELHADGTTATVGQAPYLDYRAASDDELVVLKDVRDAEWLTGNLEARALDIAITRAVPTHLAEVQARTLDRLHKVRRAVHERLTQEVNYWDFRANELLEQMQAGRQPRMNPDRARQRADELANRLKRRMADLDKEEQLRALPPVVVGAALVVPDGLVQALHGDAATAPERSPVDTTAVDRRAVAAVLATERRLGRDPEELAHNHPGYDIRSHTRDGHLMFIEVKGRISGAEMVTVTRNEILHGHNSPDRWLLALVEVRPDSTEAVRYYRHPFAGISDEMQFAETSRTFNWEKMWQAAGTPS
jgi:hypothetical protein